MDQEVGSILRNYLYFAISFSLGTEFINMKMRKKPNRQLQI